MKQLVRCYFAVANAVFVQLVLMGLFAAQQELEDPFVSAVRSMDGGSSPRKPWLFE